MLTASIGGFSATMKTAASGLKSVGNVVSEVSSKIFSLTGVLTGVASAGALVLLVKGSMESIAATGRLSDRLGIATEKLGGLQYAAKLAGVENETLTGGLEKMLKNLGEAAEKSGPVAAALASIGLNAKQLASMAPDEAFEKIADGLKSITNPAERAATTVAIFGKSGQELLPMMMQGSEGIKAAAAEAAKLGVTFNRVDAAKVELANQSIIKLQSVLTGVMNTLAIQLSPFITAVANKFVGFATSGRGATGMIVSGFGAVLNAIAYVADYLSIVEAGWQMLRSGASFALGGIVDAIGYVLDALDWLLKKLHITQTGMGQAAHDLAKGFYDTGKEAFHKAGQDWSDFATGANSKAARAAMQSIEDASNKAATAIAADAAKMNGGADAAEDWAKKLEEAAANAKKVTETLAELHKSVDTFGQTSAQKKIFDLKSLGASASQIAEAQQLIDKLGQLEAAKKKMESQQSAAKSVFESTRTPVEKYEQQIGKLSDLLNSGAIDWDTYGRAVQQARQKLEDAAKTQGPQIMESGSAEAQRYAYDQNQGQRKINSNKDEISKLQYNEQYQSRLILQRIENKLTEDDAADDETVDIG
jgi:hypothetical protein